MSSQVENLEAELKAAIEKTISLGRIVGVAPHIFKRG